MIHECLLCGQAYECAHDGDGTSCQYALHTPCPDCQSNPLKHPLEITIEKPLFQIAIERILDRLVKISPKERDDAVLILMCGADGSVAPEKAAAALGPMLFPELYPKVKEGS